MSIKFKRLSPALIKIWGIHGDMWTHAHWCPACAERHDIACDKPQVNGARWTYDGNEDKPSFEPSINIKVGPEKKGGTVEICHYFLRKGQIEFLADCTHSMAGKTVDLPVIPEKALRYFNESK